MPAKKRTYHHGDLARALVDAAVQIIERHGPDAITLRQVAASVGVTHGAAYRHFEDKAALLAAVAEEGFRALGARLREVPPVARRGHRARLLALAEAYVAYAMEHPGHYRVMSGPRINEEGRFPGLESAIQDAFQTLIGAIADGQAAGAFRPGVPRDLAISVWVSGHGFAELVHHRRIRVKSAKGAVEYFGRLLEPLLDGLCVVTDAGGRP
jgi:AcrR family transcriptional regulator